ASTRDRGDPAPALGSLLPIATQQGASEKPSRRILPRAHSNATLPECGCALALTVLPSTPRRRVKKAARNRFLWSAPRRGRDSRWRPSATTRCEPLGGHQNR